jgi:hypothetical protein
MLPITFVRFFVSSVCLPVRVTMVDKNKAVICCWLATSAIMLSEKRKRKCKMWSKKWYLKRGISCDCSSAEWFARNGDDASVVSGGKMRNLWDPVSDLRSFLCEKRLERTVLRYALCLSKLRSLLSYFKYDVTSNFAQFNWACIDHYMKEHLRLIHTYHAVPIPRPCHATTMPFWSDFSKPRLSAAWVRHGNGIACVN